MLPGYLMTFIKHNIKLQQSKTNEHLVVVYIMLKLKYEYVKIFIITLLFIWGGNAFRHFE